MVDDELEQQQGNWEFDAEVASQFDKHIRKSIPLYDEIQHRVVELSDWFIQSTEDERVYDLGCATGTTIEALVEKHGESAPPHFVGIDSKAPMLAKATTKCGDYENVEFVQEDFTTRSSYPDAPLVLSLFTMSFVTEEEREKVFRHIYDSLPKGGAFIFVEKTRASTSLFQDVWTDEYWNFKSEQGFTDEEILGKAKTLQGQLRPLSIEEYHTLLLTAGFDVENGVDIFFKWFPWAGFIARKM